MEKVSGRNLLRAQVNTPVLYRIFNIAFAALFFGILALTLFFNTNSFYSFRWYWLLCAAAGGVLITLFVYWLFTLFPDPGKRAERILVPVLLVLFVAVQVVVGWQVRVDTDNSWDYGVVFNYASDYALSGTLPDDYFLYFPNNAALYTILCGFFSLLHLLGIWDFLIPTMVLNIAAITAAVALLYFVCRRLFGVRQGLFLLLACFVTAPFILYAPILYSDTLTLPIPIGIVLLWLKTRTEWRQGRTKGVYIRFLLISLLAAAGALFKVTVLIVWIAVALDLLIFLCGKGRLRLLLAGLALLLVVYLGGSFAVRYSPLLPAYNYAKDGLPASHWVMMGLSGNGGYNDDDYQLVLAQEGRAARSDFVAGEIGSRIAEKGPLGLLQHLGTKLSYTFGDGTYTAAGKLDQSASNPGLLHEVLVHSGEYFGVFAYLTFGLEAALLFWMALAAVRSFRRRNEALTFVRIAVFGLVLFLLLWETRARYLINFLPLFLLLAMEMGPRPAAPKHPPKEEPAEGDILRRNDYGEMQVQAQPLPNEPAAPDYMDPSFEWGQASPEAQAPAPLLGKSEASELDEILEELRQSTTAAQQTAATQENMPGEQARQGPGEQEDIFSLMEKE
ncbi:hypothetical protein LJC49_01965 [Ruminococcaceae bacterium OttesenSCG-928-I18]|nr:hypothetical protein [Ruminococcaceae bacterium OttesenSCG-928-I18]